ncbi:MAG: hypothetical protein AB7V25_15340, partial [Mangrovibacterium sp.]
MLRKIRMVLFMFDPVKLASFLFKIKENFVQSGKNSAGSNSINNCQVQTLSERYFKYTYTFTQDMFDQAVPSIYHLSADKKIDLQKIVEAIQKKVSCGDSSKPATAFARFYIL